MDGSNIAGAIASIAASINDALIAGRPTAELRRQLATLEQEQRAAAARAAAEERARRTEQEALEAEEIDAKAAALAAEIEGRIAAKLAALALPAPLVVRRFPDGSSLAAATED